MNERKIHAFCAPRTESQRVLLRNVKIPREIGTRLWFNISMTRPEESAATPDKFSTDAAAESNPAQSGASKGTSTEPSVAPKLTPEEQLALYEKELKENDWGHQPC